MDLNEPVMKELKNEFIRRYGGHDRFMSVFFAPGRVNLIGEHTDYNGGMVLPFALTYGTYLLIRFNEEKNIRLASENFDYTANIPLADVIQKHGKEWINYPLGVISQCISQKTPLMGMDLFYSGNIPNGAGLSSSASIEMVTVFALNELYGMGWEMIEMIKISRKAENEFVGVNCGIMDQFAVGVGKKNHALFLNCDTLDHELVPVDLKDCALLISNTNKKRGLADSKYNERVWECHRAVELLRTRLDIKNLSDIGLRTFEDHSMLIKDEKIRRRARHVISENERVVEAVEALKDGNLDQFGAWMNDSHDSLRYDYEVTGSELDTLVDEARKIDGVLGSRMTGAGFGGCTVTLLKEDALEPFRIRVKEGYLKRTGLSPEFYTTFIGDGVHRIE
jgi:galactokinase